MLLSRSVRGTAFQETQESERSKSYYITPAVRAIEKAIGEAEVSRCWWKFTLGRTDKEWAEWYFSTQHL